MKIDWLNELKTWRETRNKVKQAQKFEEVECARLAGLLWKAHVKEGCIVGSSLIDGELCKALSDSLLEDPK